MCTPYSLSPFIRSILNISTYCVHTYPSASPRMGFPRQNLAAPIAEHIYGSSYTTGSPGRPYIPPHSMYPTVMMSLRVGSGSMRPTCSRLPAQCATAQSASVVRSGREHMRLSSKHDELSNGDNDFAPASAPTTSNEV